MTTCPECRRPYGEYDYVNRCNGRDGETCLVASIAYRRGLLAGVELAKRTAWISTNRFDPDRSFIEWEDVDTEAAKLAGESSR
jgi:hypothetical protein